ncbi:hypothetical protein NKG05_24205 [Oerskovia sp. M15]
MDRKGEALGELLGKGRSYQRRFGASMTRPSVSTTPANRCRRRARGTSRRR